MKQIIIIDDSLPIRKRIATLLAQSKQIRIACEAANAHDAIEAVERLRPDAVILDIGLPDQSGVVLLKTFKARYPKMQVIMLTNFDDARYQEQCKRLGADHFLSKTKDFNNIVVAVTGEPAH